uniref:Uncharacterized protein n=1 Tax=Amphiprion percula TaxID=161767 RepID=A0A3P8T8F8_AMPPE
MFLRNIFNISFFPPQNVQKFPKNVENVDIRSFTVKIYFFPHIFKALDEKRWLYGTHEQNMGLLGFLRVRVWMNGLRSIKNGFLGVVLRERFVLGGIFFIGQGEQGIFLEHREIEFGDKVNTQELHPLEKK